MLLVLIFSFLDILAPFSSYVVCFSMLATSFSIINVVFDSALFACHTSLYFGAYAAPPIPRTSPLMTFNC